MINFSKLSGSISNILRRLLDFLPDTIIVPILQGHLRGKRWIKGSGVNGYWLGSYELDVQDEFAENIKKGDIIFDIGAHTGFYSLLAADLTGPGGKVLSFEPLPKNTLIFKKNAAINNYKNIELLEVAVGDRDGEAKFSEGKSTFEGKLSDDGEIKVKIIKIDSLIGEGKWPPPNFIKVDVEGKFKEVLLGAKKTIEAYKPRIIFEAEFSQDKEIFKMLYGFGYKIYPIETKDLKTSLNFLAKTS